MYKLNCTTVTAQGELIYTSLQCNLAMHVKEQSLLTYFTKYRDAGDKRHEFYISLSYRHNL